MGSAAATECSVLENGTLVMMARVDNESAALITQANVSAVEYTVYLLDENYPDNPDTRTAITDHTAVAVAKASCVFDTLQTGGFWTIDETGYNFKWTLAINVTQAFTIAGRRYLVCWTITPTSGQAIRFDFLPRCK